MQGTIKSAPHKVHAERLGLIRAKGKAACSRCRLQKEEGQDCQQGKPPYGEGYDLPADLDFCRSGSRVDVADGLAHGVLPESKRGPFAGSGLMAPLPLNLWPEQGLPARRRGGRCHIRCAEQQAGLLREGCFRLVLAQGREQKVNLQ